MALIKVYDLDGQEHEKDSVDARECVAEMGWGFDPWPAPPVADITAESDVPTTAVKPRKKKAE